MSLPSSPTRASAFSFTCQLGLLGRFIWPFPPVSLERKKRACYSKASANVMQGPFLRPKVFQAKKMKICFPLANPAWLRYGIELGLRADYFQFPPNEQLTVKLQCKRKGDKFREWSAAHTDYYGGRGKVLLKKSGYVVSEPLLLICRLLSERCT